MAINKLEFLVLGGGAREAVSSWTHAARFCTKIVRLWQLKHRIDALDDQPDAMAHDLVCLQLNDVEMLAEFW